MGESESLRELCRDLWALYEDETGKHPKRCPQCGALFVGPKNKVYCCKTCGVDAYRGSAPRDEPREPAKSGTKDGKACEILGRMQELGVME